MGCVVPRWERILTTETSLGIFDRDSSALPGFDDAAAANSLVKDMTVKIPGRRYMTKPETQGEYSGSNCVREAGAQVRNDPVKVGAVSHRGVQQ